MCSLVVPLTQWARCGLQAALGRGPTAGEGGELTYLAVGA